MMNIQRYSLMAGIALVLFLLLVEWNKFNNSSVPAPAVGETTTSQDASREAITTEDAVSDSQANDIPELASTQKTKKEAGHTTNSLIRVSTDVFNIRIDPVGGDIVMVALPKYWADLSTPEIPFELLNRTSEKLYVSQSGLVGEHGTDRAGERPVFSSEKSEYFMEEGNTTLVVDLTLPKSNGVSITKRFTFTRGEYLIDVRYLIENNSNAPWRAAFFGQIKRDGHTPKTSATGLKPFLGAALTTAEENYKKMDFKEVSKSSFKEAITGGWVAMVQHYFISAWIGDREEENLFSVRQLKNDDVFLMGYTSPEKVVAPGARAEIGGQFYAGPKITKRLEQIAPYLDLTVDYGWLWWVAKPIHWVLQMIHEAVQNWGWSIVMLTLLIKVVLFPLSHKAYISMGHMRKVAPKMAAIKEQCGDNRQKLQEEMMKLYRTEKINPLGGCLPMMLQMPVFIALYWVLMESVELRHAPFVAWIKDLSVMDPWFVLPILMGASMYFQQKMNPAPPDPMQAKIMQYLPFIFTIMFLWFPAGLVLYWLVNNISSMIHQGYINRLTEEGKL